MPSCAALVPYEKRTLFHVAAPLILLQPDHRGVEMRKLWKTRGPDFSTLPCTLLERLHGPAAGQQTSRLLQ
jgi:hypothetical protein